MRTSRSGTTVDTFLRENMEWLSRATNWAKFSATAGLGVIHKCVRDGARVTRTIRVRVYTCVRACACGRTSRSYARTSCTPTHLVCWGA